MERQRLQIGDVGVYFVTDLTPDQYAPFLETEKYVLGKYQKSKEWVWPEIRYYLLNGEKKIREFSSKEADRLGMNQNVPDDLGAWAMWANDKKECKPAFFVRYKPNIVEVKDKNLRTALSAHEKSHPIVYWRIVDQIGIPQPKRVVYSPYLDSGIRGMVDSILRRNYLAEIFSDTVAIENGFGDEMHHRAKDRSNTLKRDAPELWKGFSELVGRGGDPQTRRAVNNLLHLNLLVNDEGTCGFPFFMAGMKEEAAELEKSLFGVLAEHKCPQEIVNVYNDMKNDILNIPRNMCHNPHESFKKLVKHINDITGLGIGVEE